CADGLTGFEVFLLQINARPGLEGRRSRCDSNGGVGAPEPRNAVISGLFVCKKNDNFKEKIAVQNEKN
ncbi:MAG: hypothetical protein IIT73_05395, partial [Treponema sp.]|nr:hypothetical protein [Treponema sp.]